VPAGRHPQWDAPIAGLALVYCLWLLYAAGLKYVLLSALLYAPGAVLYIWARRQRAERPFTGAEAALLAALVLLALVSAAMLWAGSLSL